MTSKKEATQLFLKNKLQLQATYVEILDCYLLKNFTQKQVAIHFKQPISTTKSQIAKALLELRKASNDPEYLKGKEILYGVTTHS
jgi:hypothetical protein